MIQKYNSNNMNFQTNKNLVNLLNYTQPLIQSLIYWPIYYGQKSTVHNLRYWYYQGFFLKQYKRFRHFWKSELLIKVVSRNINVILYTAQMWSLEDKQYICLTNNWRQWRSQHAAKLLYMISAGRCGFKTFETNSFIAGDTTVRAGLWLLSRNMKKLTPVKLYLSGLKNKIDIYFNRVKLLQKFFSFDDVTPRPWNGCWLLHYPRKRFRYHSKPLYYVARAARLPYYRITFIFLNKIDIEIN